MTSKANHIRVVTRIRPINPQEITQGCIPCVTVIPNENAWPDKVSPVKKKGPFAFLTPNKRIMELPTLVSTINTPTTPLTRNTSHRGRLFHSSPSKGTSMIISDQPVFGSATSLLIGLPCNDNSQKQFDYDAVLDENASQFEVYKRTVGDSISQNIFRGCNTTILAYGQSGSGKTYTMSGGLEGTDQEGIRPRAIRDLFRAKSNHDGDVTITITYVEIYNDEIRDLLIEESSIENAPLKLRDQGPELIVEGLVPLLVKNEAEARRLMEIAVRRRTNPSFKIDSRISRSHTICTLAVNITPKKKTASVANAKLVLVDLAGSERIKQTGILAFAKQENININKDLFVLAKVLSALADQSKSKKNLHVPYRDSKLTRLLRDSLGRNCCTVMVACVSPTNVQLEESVNTLRYAERTRVTANTAKQNVVKTISTELDDFRAENKMLLLKVLELKTNFHRKEERTKADTSGWKTKYENLLAAADDAGIDLTESIKIKEQRDAIFRTMEFVGDDTDVSLATDIAFNKSLFDEDDDVDSTTIAINSRLAAIKSLDLEIALKQTQLEKLQQDVSKAENDSAHSATVGVSANIVRRLIVAPSDQFSEIELPLWDSIAVKKHDVNAIMEEHEDTSEKEKLTIRSTRLEIQLRDQKLVIRDLEDQLSIENRRRCEETNAFETKVAKIVEERDLYKIQCAINIDEVQRLQHNLINSASRQDLEKARRDLEKALSDYKNFRETMMELPSQTGIDGLLSSNVSCAQEDSDANTFEVDENNPQGFMPPLSTSFDDATIESDGGDSQASNHAAIRIHAAKMLFWANKAIERGKNARNGQSVCSSIASSTGNGSDFKPDMRGLQAITSTVKEIPMTGNAYMKGKPPRALPRPSENEIVFTGMEKVVKDASICHCQGSAFSGNAAHVNFYLPKLGMACTCGKKEVDESLDCKDPTSLENILRPWQVDFLKSLNIRRAEDLVYQYYRRSDILAKEMRRWRKDKNLVSVKTKSCGVALHIWNRTCKVIVKSVNLQRENCVFNLQKPNILEISLSDNQTLSTMGWGGIDAYEANSQAEL